MDKQIEKKLARKCHFCTESDYSALNVHRIKPGAEGGKYREINTCVVCGNCHAKIHANKIRILGKHYSTAGRYILHYIDENNQEHWD